ncbi:unnamed protein product [Schistosoma curassoni]|uniref:Uncharacterized protein n=1 Tax=Schistosoma curassoni TaxID=6186 RepID=A0A183JJK4_9TREM|nr:unnamed protein product [Schistosoma curassoni]
MTHRRIDHVMEESVTLKDHLNGGFQINLNDQHSYIPNLDCHMNYSKH